MRGRGKNRQRGCSVTAQQVGVGRDNFYALMTDGNLIVFDEDAGQHEVLMRGIARFSSGDSGVLAITNDRARWSLSGNTKRRLASDVAVAAVGDGANYYITCSGDLYVKGRAHRGQYGDGPLKSTDQFVPTASNASYVTAHTGRAILLLANGNVLGTGGNIYGPIGKHGLDDKAIRWSPVMSGARAIATGSPHSLAMLQNDVLVAWDRGYDTEAMFILSNVAAVAAGSRTSIALTPDNTLWQWGRSQAPRHVPLTDEKLPSHDVDARDRVRSVETRGRSARFPASAIALNLKRTPTKPTT